MLARRRRRLGALILSDRTEPGDPAKVAEALASAVAAQDLRPLPWTDAARQLQARVALMRGIEPDGRLAGSLRCCPESLDCRTGSRRTSPASRGSLIWQKLDLLAILRGRMPWELASRLDHELPSHLNLPTGRAAIDYTEAPPLASAKAQAFYGMATTPDAGRRPYSAPPGAVVSRRTADRSDGGPRRLLERGLG